MMKYSHYKLMRKALLLIMAAGVSQKFLVVILSLKHDQMNYFLPEIATVAQHHMITPVKAHDIVHSREGEKRREEEEQGAAGSTCAHVARTEGKRTTTHNRRM